jgi:two-component system sensor histidine kinase/response regulator
LPPLGPFEELAGTYDYRLVALSVVIAVVASYAALDLSGRVTASRGRLRPRLPDRRCRVHGHGHLVDALHRDARLSTSGACFLQQAHSFIFFAGSILASAVALFVVSRNKLGLLRISVGGVLMGSGIAAIHYVGMDAMRLPPTCQYSQGLVELSVLLAFEILLIALSLAFHLRAEINSMSWRKLVSATVMGLAIPVMHYTGMAAATFRYSAAPIDLTNSMEISSIGTVSIGGVTFLVLFLAADFAPHL